MTALRRDGERLVFEGPLLRDDVATAWPRALALLDGARVLDLQAVPRVDSAGLAMLAELAARAGSGVRIDGAPEGLVELRAAYRLSEGLAYAD